MSQSGPAIAMTLLSVPLNTITNNVIFRVFIKLTNKTMEEILKAIREVVEKGQFINGDNVKALEKEIAEYCGTKYAVSCNSGTDALVLSLKALCIGRGDEVITTPFTFIATAEAIANVGATPVFVDIKEDDFNIDPYLIEEKITQKTKAIMPVHLFGNLADMEVIRTIADKYLFGIIEDAAQAFGTEGIGRGDCATISFYPSKSLGACGDGGMVITNSEELAGRIKMLRNHGSSPTEKYLNLEIGTNSRLDEIQAAVLRVKLKNFNGGKIQTYRFPNRDALKQILAIQGIQTFVYYPLPLHLQPAFKYLGYQVGDLPVAEKAAKEVLSFPIKQ